MDSVRLDFNDLGGYVDRTYGKVQDDAPGIEGVRAIAFRPGGEGRPCSRIDGKNVYIHRDYPGIIQPGEIWICSLDFSPVNGGTYFAVPVRRVDDSLLLEATRSDIASLADTIWKENPGFLEKVLEKRIGEIADERAKAGIEACRKQCDATVANLEGLKTGLEAAVNEKNERIRELEETVEDLEEENGLKDARIVELGNTVRELEEAIAQKDALIEGQHDAATAPGCAAEEYVIDDDPSDETEQYINGVVRADPVTIQSRNLVHDRYSMHVSTDWTIMILRPDPQGTVECVSNSVSIDMLAWNVPYKGMAIIAAEFGDGGEITMHLA